MAVSLILYWFCLPDPLFKSDYSTVLEDRNRQLLSAKIADDGQWRFPLFEDIPEKFGKALIEFEDQNFYSHPGIDPVAVVRAVIQNYEAGKVVSGASTLSMQVIRLAKNNPKRTVWEKIKEMIQATRLEVGYSKKEILALYAAHAPFGGNTVGLEAASWRYFGRSAQTLSWAESAMLAVLPNSPGLIHPGRNREALKKKRDRLLERLYASGEIDSLTVELSKLEPLPDKPHPLPQLANHFLVQSYLNGNEGTRIVSTIDKSLQEKVSRLVERHHNSLQHNDIQNAAVLILDVNRKQIAAYVGNTEAGKNHDENVDIIKAPRSSGSILKPLLYMLKLGQGDILPHTLVPDVPSRFAGFYPKNYTRTYSGAVPASEALARSLNVPSVYMLQEFGVPDFHYYLNQLGFSTIDRSPGHYGLSLILGGAETTLWDITSVYASLASALNEYDARSENAAKYKYIHSGSEPDSRGEISIDPGAIWSTFEAMVEVNRPQDESYWKRFTGSRKVAWKTGTSHGNRDGWAVGITPEYVVGVWVGNADGEGRPELTGVKTAGPILFDIFDLLPASTWFNEPLYALEEIEVCALSGHRKGPDCSETEVQKVPAPGLKTTICPYHTRIHLNAEKTKQVHSGCNDVTEIRTESWFVLPGDQEWYYRESHPGYRSLPPFDEACSTKPLSSLKMIYPFEDAKIYVPVELDGTTGRTVLEAVHRNPETLVYWHLNGEFKGVTSRFHQLSVLPEPGKHKLVLVDENGERLTIEFDVIGRR